MYWGIYEKNILFIAALLGSFSITEAIFDSEKNIRIENSLYWGAFGDALGAPVEFMQSVREIVQKDAYNADFLVDGFNLALLAVRNYYKAMKYYFDYMPYTDDTRMTLLVLGELQNVHNGLLKNFTTEKSKENDLFFAIARSFKKDFFDKMNGWSAHFRMPGISTINAVEAWPEKISKITEVLLPQLTFEKPENDKIGGGCGSVMHAAPFGYFKDCCKFAGKHSVLTHNHPIAIAACASLAYGIDSMIYEKKSKQEIIKTMIDIAEQYEREASSGQYQLRMRPILEAAVSAAHETIAFRAKTAGKNRNPYLISFHELVKNEEFLSIHERLFPKRLSKNYNYTKAEFPGWDAATCLAAAVYNFILWIPENINELEKNDRIRCLTNSITSAIITGGDSDSMASVTGQLSGAYMTKPSVPVFLKSIIEDGDRIQKYATGI